MAWGGARLAYRITITTEAESQLHALRVHERRTVEAAIESRLQKDPLTPTRSIKRLRPNPFAKFEMRVGDFRVLYNVEANEVVLLLVGRKVGNKLIVKGEEFHAHQDNPSQPSGDKPSTDAQ